MTNAAKAGLFCCLVFSSPVFAASVNLAWDQPTDSSIVGYTVHYGPASGSYNAASNVGNVGTATISGLSDGVTYYFVVNDYAADGTTSPYSNEVNVTTPQPPPPPPPPPGDTTPPVVAISLVDGQVLRGNGKVTVAVSATDDVGVTMVTLSIDGAVTSSTNASSLSYQWNLKNVSRGQHTISVTARDAAGNQATKTITVTRQ